MESKNINQQQKEFLSVLGYTYLKCNKLEKATVVYQALYHLFPDSEYFAFCLSYLYLQQDKYAKALYYANAHIRQKKREIKFGYLLKSQALYHLGRRKQAKECARAFIQSQNL